MDGRIIGHLDMDAFFASVEERDKPYLKGLPLVIGSDPQGGKGRGVVSTASYAARKYGVHSAVPISKAWQLCEEGKKKGGKACVFIAPSMGKYSRASKEVFTILSHIVSDIEQVSVDEAYLDLSFARSFKGAEKVAKQVQRKIKKETKLTCSVGIGPNKLIAKIASDYKKPQGCTVITPRRAEKFLAGMPLRAIPGIGPKTAQRLISLNIHTVQDARTLSWQELGDMFGKWGFEIYERLRGVDERSLEIEAERKSIGKHYTFAQDTKDMEEVFGVLREQTSHIVDEIHKRKFNGFKTTVITMRFEGFVTKTRSVTVKELLHTKKQLEAKAIKLALPFFDRKENPSNKAIRLVGLRVEKLE